MSGNITAGFSFHTRVEDRPWWRLDLETTSLVSEIRLFNRLSSEILARRAYALEILLSNDGETWDVVFSKDDNTYFGGVDGRPLICSLSPPVAARWVQVQLKTRDYLHLAQVQVFGPA